MSDLEGLRGRLRALKSHLLERFPAYGRLPQDCIDALEAQAGEIERLRAKILAARLILSDFTHALAPDVTEIVIDSPQEKI